MIIHTVFYRRRFCLQTVAMLSVSLLLFYSVCLLFYGASAVTGEIAVNSEDSGKTVILDAGHGGEDCGAIGVTGVYEKDLNLSVTERLAAMLRSAGVRVIETRTEDRLLYKESENIKGYRKIYDLKNRLQVSLLHPEAVFVSIHMNNFSESRYRGLQIYYSENNPASMALAGSMQALVKAELQPDNQRKIKPSNGNIYLLDEAESPAILVECGFLSNPEECEKLSTEDYQKQLCFVLFCGIMNAIHTSQDEK